MQIAASQSVTIVRGQVDSDGLPSSSTHTAVLWKNGAATAEAVTTGNPSTGSYSFAFVIPANAVADDIFSLRVVDGDGFAATVWEGVVARPAVLDSTALDEIKGTGWDDSTDTLKKIRDAITLVSSTSVVIPSPVSDVIGMPETLEIGDSYDEDTPIKLYVRDENDDPVTSFSGHDLTDPDFAPTFTIAPTPGSSRGRVVGTVTWVPAVGPVEGYLNVDIPSSQSRRAVEGESTVQCILKWDGYEKTILTTTVRWLPRI